MIHCLENFKIPITELRLWASSRSKGKVVDTFIGPIILTGIDDKFFSGLDFALFSAGWDISREWIPRAVELGVRVIDNSSAFRYEDSVPLIIPAVNAHAIGDARIIANPNCTTAIALMAVSPIYAKYGIKKMIVSTYQATSGAGAKWMDELLRNTQKYFAWEKAEAEVFVENIAFNVIPHIDKFQENGYTKEEMKVVWETQKILGDDTLEISCTAVRIPTLRAHSESIILETREKVDIEEIRDIMRHTPGVDLVDDTENNRYPMPMNAMGKYNVEVGRIRKNLIFADYGVELFVSGDQLLRGAALNAVEILDVIINQK
jgi:aspartate-semialdehyde dehydrogenase